jgi:hypothetical protein
MSSVRSRSPAPPFVEDTQDCCGVAAVTAIRLWSRQLGVDQGAAYRVRLTADLDGAAVFGLLIGLRYAAAPQNEGPQIFRLPQLLHEFDASWVGATPLSEIEHLISSTFLEPEQSHRHHQFRDGETVMSTPCFR